MATHAVHFCEYTVRDLISSKYPVLGDMAIQEEVGLIWKSDIIQELLVIVDILQKTSGKW